MKIKFYRQFLLLTFSLSLNTWAGIPDLVKKEDKLSRIEGIDIVSSLDAWPVVSVIALPENAKKTIISLLTKANYNLVYRSQEAGLRYDIRKAEEVSELGGFLINPLWLVMKPVIEVCLKTPIKVVHLGVEIFRRQNKTVNGYVRFYTREPGEYAYNWCKIKYSKEKIVSIKECQSIGVTHIYDYYFGKSSVRKTQLQ